MPAILYFDPFNGASGDMILGALVDLGLPLEHLNSELSKLGIEGFEIRESPVDRQGLRGTNLEVRLVHSHESAGPLGSKEPPHSHHHEPAHDGEGGDLGRILRIIEGSQLDRWVKDKASQIFQRLGEAEAKVHGTDLSEVHFHEVGAVDSIVDIIGACIGFRYFEIEEFYSAPLALGGGTVTFSHGTWPVPAPATVELVLGFPSYAGPVQCELTTPTGAAIVTTLVGQASSLPVCHIVKSGFGAGDRELKAIPNMLRIMLGRRDSASEEATPEFGVGQQEDVIILEASIDNMEPETLGYFLDRALNQGALDVYYSSLQMKKSRPGVLLTLLCRPADRNRMAELIFSETTTLGLRWKRWRRWVLDREVTRLETRYGSVRIKIGRSGRRIMNIWPEYEDLKQIAENRNMPFKEVRAEVLRRIEDFNDEQ
jgi:uncharacterized protein (TIGR00299 family) protein